MTRIGRVKVWGWSADETVPCFRFIIENGGASLGCWKCVGRENLDWSDPKCVAPRTIFERIS